MVLYTDHVAARDASPDGESGYAAAYVRDGFPGRNSSPASRVSTEPSPLPCANPGHDRAAAEWSL